MGEGKKVHLKQKKTIPLAEKGSYWRELDFWSSARQAHKTALL